ncbi:FtsX-like permease family protein [Microbulbifer sp. ANSA003]|uniref:FtsX-like permease family protein n=1 Tax=Microbulbifer sp. ANSA003 TaxID=3243360 RepID=UPI0040423FA0
MLIWLFIQNETGYDRHYQDAEQIYRVTTRVERGADQEPIVVALTSPPVGTLLKADFDVVDSYTRLMMGSFDLSYQRKNFKEKLYFADANFFDIFDLKVLAGNLSQALSTPEAIVLTKDRAIKYFGSPEAAINKTMLLDNQRNVVVTAVLDDLPENTHLSFNVLLSMEMLQEFFGDDILEDWNGRAAGYTYIKLTNGKSISPVLAGMPEFIKNRLPNPEMQRLEVQGITDIHLHSARKFEMKEGGDVSVIFTMALVAFTILLMACFNYINLSTALATMRSKEVGVRKVLGAEKGQLIAQFMTESAVTAIISAVLAVAALAVLLPYFNNFLSLSLQLGWQDLEFWGGFVAVLAVVILLGGGYSAFYQSSLNPIVAIHNSDFLPSKLGGTQLRKLLVVAQFTVSVVLMIATMVVYLQVNFAKNIDLGYDDKDLLVLYGAANPQVQEAYELMKTQWQSHPGIDEVTASSATPPVSLMGRVQYRIPSANQSEFDYIAYNAIDYNFFSTYDIGIIAGRGFSEAQKGDAFSFESGAGVVINERAVEVLGWANLQQALGQQMLVKSLDGEREVMTTIVGISENVHMSSVHDPIHPQLYFVMLPYMQDISIRIRGDRQEAMNHIRQVWQQRLPNVALVSGFVDVGIESLYRDEEHRLKLFTGFSVLAVSIALLGLFGLSMFTAQRKVKEIGVRKVLGAELSDIVALLSKDFTKLVVIANILGIPLAYYLMSNWLEQFSYRIDMPVLSFAVVFVLTLLLSVATIASQAVRVASLPPANSLRDE